MEISRLEWVVIDEFTVSLYRYKSYFRLYVIETLDKVCKLHIYSIAGDLEASQIKVIHTNSIEEAKKAADTDMRNIDTVIKDREELYDTYPD